jgi:two-component system chemotaxis response regulator CheB
LLEKDPRIRVIGAAPDPLFALQKMEKDWPDVIVLDVEMPRMDGITFLKKLMAERPTPVVICSTLTEQGAEVSFQAVQAGAFAIIAKPRLGLSGFLQGAAQEFTDTIKAAASARMAPLLRRPEMAPLAPLTQTTDQVVAIGTSTGGTRALETVLTALPAVCPGIVVVQHMPAEFTAAFAARLNQLCLCDVKEAAHHDRVLPGQVLIAPGGRHMQLARSGAQYYVEIIDGPPVNRHKPSVDVLFRSVAKHAGRDALGIIMTGMGDDGANGLLEMRKAGATTVAQDEASCVVFGMPKEAIARGAAMHVLPLNEIGAALLGGYQP